MSSDCTINLFNYILVRIRPDSYGTYKNKNMAMKEEGSQ